MNAIQKFAEEHGADNSASLEKTFQDAVQSVIGDKGTVGGAWCYEGSNDYGYNDWEASITGLDGMLPTDEIVIVLSTDLDNGKQWLGGRYMDDAETIAEASDSEEQFDPTPIINQLLAEVQKKRSSRAEAKKHTCSMQKKKESLAKKNEGKSIDEILEILRSDKYKEDAKRLRDAYQEFETLARRLGYRLVIPNFDGYAPTVLPEDVIDDVMDLLPMSYKQSGDLVDNSQIVGNVCPFIFD